MDKADKGVGETKWRWPQASLPHIIYYNNMFITKSIIRHISASTLVSQRQSITPKCFYKDFAQNLFLQSISTTKCCQRLHLHIIYYERCLTVHHGQSPVRAAKQSGQWKWPEPFKMFKRLKIDYQILMDQKQESWFNHPLDDSGLILHLKTSPQAKRH